MFKNKNVLITIVASLFIIQIAVAPKLCIDAAVSGALLFFYKVFPCLFPFLVISNIILAYDGVYIYSKIFGNLLCRPLNLPKECGFVLIVSMLCGYPLGAKYSCDLYERRIINRSTFLRVLNIASNPSPIFILGTVGISMLNNSYAGYILLFSTYLSCFILGMFLPGEGYKKSFAKAKHEYSPINFGNALKASVDNGLSTSMSIGGFVVIFSVITAFVSSKLHLSIGILNKIFLGIIEMTNGCSIISNTDYSLTKKLMIISFILAFSGFSIITQVYSFTSRHEVSILKYTGLKVIQGLLCSLITYISCRFTLNETSVFVSSISYHSNVNMITYAILILILPFVFYKIFKLFKFS